MSGLFVFVILNVLLRSTPISSTPIFGREVVMPYGNASDAYDDRIFFLQPTNSNSNANTCVSSATCCRYRCAAVTMAGTGVQIASECATGATAGLAAGRCISSDGTAASIAPGALCIFSVTCPACFTAGTTIACVGQQECTTILGNAICPWT